METLIAALPFIMFFFGLWLILQAFSLFNRLVKAVEKIAANYERQ